MNILWNRNLLLLADNDRQGIDIKVIDNKLRYELFSQVRVSIKMG